MQVLISAVDAGDDIMLVMMVLFPEVAIVDDDLQIGMIANQKAVAFQTYKTLDLEVTLRQSWMFASYADLFAKQCTCRQGTAPRIDVPRGGSWIAYPYAIVSENWDGFCLVFRDAERQYRHIRLYSSAEHARRDNARIEWVLDDLKGSN